MINNPWCFDYCLDREEQRVDNLFINGSLKNLTGLDLSGFYQTVDNKTIQDLCYNHLSSNSFTDEHLQNVRDESVNDLICTGYFYIDKEKCGNVAPHTNRYFGEGSFLF